MSRSQLFSLAFDILLNLVQYLVFYAKIPTMLAAFTFSRRKQSGCRQQKLSFFKNARSNLINNTVKPKFHLPFELLGSQSCKSDTKRNQTDYNGQIYLSIATKTNQLIRVAKSEMDPHFKTTSLLKSREKRSTDVLPFSSGFR